MSPNSRYLHAALPLGLAAAVLALAGCGAVTTTRTEFPSNLRNADGTPIHVEDVRGIVDDENLTNSEKRDALVALGLEDDVLVDALLTLPPPTSDEDETGDEEPTIIDLG